MGSLLARIILKNNPDIKILCLCYTNHALDQFLEYLIDDGVTDIVRLGSRSKSDVVEKYNLSSLAYNYREEFSRDTKRRFAQVSSDCDALRDEIEELQREIYKFENPLNVDWCDMQTFVEAEVYYQFTMIEVEDGFQYGNKKANAPNYLWKLWLSNKPLPAYLSERCNMPMGYIWKMLQSQRLLLVRGWLHEHLQGLRQDLVATFCAYRQVTQELRNVRNETKRSVLAQARVIGATTSGAANCKDLLDSCGVQVILVEEAGEVLEAHVVTSLTASVEHLILIGDHQQLRPKVESYELQVVSGRGYDLDRSLFERLVLHSDLKPSVLATQRRMQPQISRMIKFTYPNLIDHASVSQYPNVKGLLKNVLFLDHFEHESSTNGAFSNQFEVEICVQIMRLFLLNGYKTEQLVILTPYLGQLMKIQSHIRNEIADVQALVSDIDRAELFRQGFCNDEGGNDIDLDGNICVDSDKAKKKFVRTATIDNFQGEEADVVIISLVRSNCNGQVGFLKEPERVNVLLSRARHGMIVVGNTNTFRESRKAAPVWLPILDYLKEEACIVNAIPSFCQLHPADVVHLKTVDDFKTKRPSGGCNKQCEFRMMCGHVCTQFCHFIDRAHEHQKCFKPCLRVPGQCAFGHPCKKLCYQDCGECQVRMPDVKLACGHMRNVTCHDISNPERKDSLKCLVTDIPAIMPDCRHSVKLSCVQHQKESTEWVCTLSCDAVLECGHPCRDSCHTCRERGHHSESCQQKCERSLFCGHVCGQACHDKCDKCTQPCYVKCTHSQCPKRCFEVCSTCIEPCDWECEHKGKCELLCGAPCSRLPCDLRCAKKLPCGHRCPTVCGENCPSVDYCQECGNKKEEVPDIIEMETFASCDINSDPICVLPCGHFYTISTLDGHMQLSEYYFRDGNDNEEGSWVHVRPLSAAEDIGKPKSCPACKAVIHSVYRYGRMIRNSELRLLERKFRYYITSVLSTVSQQESGLKKLYALEELITTATKRTPTRKLYEAMQGKGQVEIAEPPSVSILQAAIEYGGALLQYVAASSSWLNEKGSKSDALLSSTLEVADTKGYTTKGADLRLVIVKFRLKRFPSLENRRQIGQQQNMIDMLNWILETAKNSRAPLNSQCRAAEHLKQAITGQISAVEVKDILRAMERNTGYDQGSTWSSHWYECPNGHAYFIGECGQAMEESVCPECGALIGGRSHSLNASNRTVSDLFRFTQH